MIFENGMLDFGFNPQCLFFFFFSFGFLLSVFPFRLRFTDGQFRLLFVYLGGRLNFVVHSISLTQRLTTMYFDFYVIPLVSAGSARVCHDKNACSTLTFWSFLPLHPIVYHVELIKIRKKFRPLLLSFLNSISSDSHPQPIDDDGE